MSEPIERFRRLMRLLGQALELPPDARVRSIEEQAADDSELRDAALELLAAHEAARRRLVQDATTVTRPVAAAPVRGGDPSDPGRYSIVKEIGAGGMGVVYLARQEHPIRRRVALKVIHQGMNTARVLARFDAERQALALMEHSGIARIFDAGSTNDGRPYFVMEYVDGRPLTGYCDAQRLSLEARLGLFRRVCTAVQHAHRRGVLHRDLKPSNILVAIEDGEPTPKVIDFGIAKAIERPPSGAKLTADGGLVGTPPYMPPEQVAADSTGVDTRADVYALGVVLYELLVGMRPFGDAELLGQGIDSLRRVLLEVPAPRPSRRLAALARSDPARAAEQARLRRVGVAALTRRLRDGLDRVVLKCLEKEPDRRYESPAELSRDIERFLRHEPVRAAPPSLAYRVAKFVRRRRVPLAVATALILLVGFGAYQMVQGRRARAVADRGEAARLVERARYVGYTAPDEARRMLERAAVLAPDDPAPRLESARLLVLTGRRDAAVSATERLVERFPEEGEAHALLAGLLADDDGDRAAHHAGRAKALLAAAAPSPRRGDARLSLALSYGAPPSEALRLLGDSIEQYAWDFEPYWHRARIRFDEALDHEYHGRTEQAWSALEAALRDSETMTRNRDEFDLGWVQRGAALITRSRWRRASAEPERAVVDAEAALAALNQAVRYGPNGWRNYFNRALARRELALALEGQEQPGSATEPGLLPDADRAERERVAAIEDLDEAIRRNPDRDTLFVEKHRVLTDLGRHAQAIATLTAAIERGHDTAEIRKRRGISRLVVRDGPGALEDLELAEARLPEAEQSGGLLVEILLDRARTLYFLGRAREAYAVARRAAELDDASDDAALLMAKSAAELGQADEAERCFARAIARAADPSGHWLEQGIGALKLGRYGQAAESFERYARVSELYGDWIRIWVWEAERLRGDRAAAVAALPRTERVADPFLVQILGALHGEVSPDELIRAGEAWSVDDAGKLYALYYLGVAAFVDGRHDAAADWFRRARALGYFDYQEHDLAGWHLARIAAAGAALPAAGVRLDRRRHLGTRGARAA